MLPKLNLKLIKSVLHLSSPWVWVSPTHPKMTNQKIVFLAVPKYSECWIMLPLNFLRKSNNIFWPMNIFRKILWVPDDYPPKKTQTKLGKPNKLVRDLQIK